MMAPKKPPPASVQKERILQRENTIGKKTPPQIKSNSNQLARKGTMKSSSTIILRIRRLKSVRRLHKPKVLTD